MKFRVIPYLFQDIVTDSHLIKDSSVVRIKPAHSFIVRDANERPSFAIILISTYFLEALNNEEDLDYIIAYEIYSVTSSIKYQRGGMEQEIYNLVSQSRDNAEESLYSNYSRELISKTKSTIDSLLNSLLERKTPILRVYD